MSYPDEELRIAVALFRYGLIADVLRLPPGSREIRRTLHEKAQRTYTIPGTRRIRVAVETMRDWLSLYRNGGFEALYPKTRADRGRPRRMPPELAELLVSLKTKQPALSVKALIDAARERGVEHPLAPRPCTGDPQLPSGQTPDAALQENLLSANGDRPEQSTRTVQVPFAKYARFYIAANNGRPSPARSPRSGRVRRACCRVSPPPRTPRGSPR